MCQLAIINREIIIAKHKRVHWDYQDGALSKVKSPLLTNNLNSNNMPTFWEVAGPLLGKYGFEIAGGAIQRSQSRKDIREQNEYNKPINQLARMREAGLPMAAMTGAISGTQSSLPVTNQGGTQALSGFITTRMQLKQLELIDAQIDATEATTKKTIQEAQGVANKNQIDTMDPLSGDPVSYLARKARLDILTNQAEQVIRENSRDVGSIDLAVKRDLQSDGTLSKQVRQQLEHLVYSTKIQIQAERRGRVLDKLITALEKDGMSTSEAFIHAIITGALGASNITRN